MTDRYILDGTTPVPEPDLFKWAEWFEDIENRKVKHDVKDGVQVSTIFLGLNHRILGKGKPLLFETMVFGGEHNLEMERYETWNEAVKGHAKFVRKFLYN